MAFSPDGRRLASSSVDATVRIWDAEADQQARVLRTDSGWFPGVAFSPDGTRLAAADVDGTVRVRDATTGEELQVLRPRHRAGLGGGVQPRRRPPRLGRRRMGPRPIPAS